MDRAVIADLVERVGRATGPDRELDRGIYDAFCPETIDEGWFWLLAREYTASIDAALALVERVLPGTMRAVGTMEGGPFCRLVYPAAGGLWSEAVSMEQDGGPSSEPLAILAALLSALSDDGGPHAGN